MKNPKFVSISIMAIILLFAFSTLLALASSSYAITNFEYVGYNTDTYYDEFQWSTYTAGGEIKMYIKDGGITDVWMRVQNRKVEHLNTGVTRLSITALQNTAGTTLKYRVKVGNSGWSDIVELDFT